MPVESPVSVAGPVDDVPISVVAAVVLPDEDSSAPLLLVSAGLDVDVGSVVVGSTLVLAGPSSSGTTASSPGHAPRAKGRDSKSSERQASEVTRASYRSDGRSLHPPRPLALT
jgi:hypothetical protein